MTKIWNIKRVLIKLESNSYFNGGRHRSGTAKNYGRRTSKGSKVLNGYCSICSRNKSMLVSGNTIKAEGLDSFFKNLAGKNTC